MSPGADIARKLASEGLTTEEIRSAIHHEATTQGAVMIDILSEGAPRYDQQMAWCRGRLVLLREMEAYLDTLTHTEESEPESEPAELNCPLCSGSGKVTPVEDPFGEPGDMIDECPRCAGRGIVAYIPVGSAFPNDTDLDPFGDAPQ